MSAFFTFSCAKLDPLSDGQKNQAFSTLQSAGRAYNVARSGIQSPSAPAAASPNSSDAVFRQMSGQIRDRIKSRDCRIRMIAPDPYDTESFQGIKRTFMLLRVWGEEYCPINLDFRITTLLEPSIGRWAISYDYSYSVSDDTYRSLNDVDAIELHGGTSINGRGTDQLRSETDMKGTLHSHALGDVHIESFGGLSGPSADRFSGAITWNFSYADFTAELVKSYDNGHLSYSLNQENFSADDFNRYFAQGGDPFTYASNPDLIH